MIAPLRTLRIDLRRGDRKEACKVDELEHENPLLGDCLPALSGYVPAGTLGYHNLARNSARVDAGTVHLLCSLTS